MGVTARFVVLAGILIAAAGVCVISLAAGLIGGGLLTAAWGLVGFDMNEEE